MINIFINLSPVAQAIVATFFTWGVTALGSSLVFFFKKTNRTIMDAMLGFAAGVMISASFWSLLSPGIEMAEKLKINAWLITLLGFLSGGLLLFTGDNMYKHYLKTHPHHKNEEKKEGFKRSLMLIFSITLHNIPEGLAVGVAYGVIAYGIEGATLGSAILLTIGIGLQNFPEGSAVSLPLRREGYSRLKSFLYGQASGIVEPIAGFTGAVLVKQMRFMLPFMLSFAAGAMIYVVVQELIPESQTNKQKDVVALFTLLGFAVMMVLDVALG